MKYSAFMAYIGAAKALSASPRGFFGFVDDKGLVALRMQVGDVRFLLVLDC